MGSVVMNELFQDRRILESISPTARFLLEIPAEYKCVLRVC